MSPIKNFLAAALYILPSIALVLTLPDLVGLDQKLSLMAGLIVCLLGAEAHAAIARGFAALT